MQSEGGFIAVHDNSLLFKTVLKVQLEYSVTCILDYCFDQIYVVSMILLTKVLVRFFNSSVSRM